MSRHAGLDDGELVRRFLEGERWTFDALMERHEKRIHRLALGMLGDPDAADDIAQETFIRAFRALPSFEFRASFGTWLHRIAVNLCLSRLRSARRHPLVALGDVVRRLRTRRGQPERDLARKDLATRIERAVAALPPKQRAVFLMRHREGLDYGEIAAALQRSEGGVRANHFQALQKLKRELSDEDALDD
ncbi:sigma-70 family RNA polymerase sigma factor [bacterium]|nr:sigma-70 family RNA polymerase sigma factor [bacterium]